MIKVTPTSCRTCASRGNSVFCDLGDHQLLELDKAKTTNGYQKHQVLFYEGNEPFGLFCVSSGKIKLYKSDGDGHQKIVKILGPGEITGYRSLLCNQSYSATAETLEEARVCFIDRTTFFHILETHPKTVFHVMSGLAKDLGSSQEQELNLVHKNVRERLAEALLVLSRSYGRKNGKGLMLELCLTRQEIADLIGTTQESAIRLLSEFRKEGLIATEKRSITLLDTERLAEEAKLSL